MPMTPATAAAPTARLHGLAAVRAPMLADGVASHALSHATHLARRPGEPLLGGNRARLLQDGPDSAGAACKAIDGARDHINIELGTVQTAGAGGVLVDKLIARCLAGVRVNLLHDSLGSLAAAPQQLQRLRAAGAQLCGYKTVWRWQAWASRALKLRAHRRLLVVDGRVGFIGGGRADNDDDNVDSDGQKNMATSASAAPGLNVQLEGPAVRRLQQLFIAQWLRHSGSALQQARYFPPLAPVDTHRVGVAACEAGRCSNAQHGALLGAIAAARSQVLLSTAHLAPSRGLLGALLRAAERGVRVELLVPATGAGWPPLLAGLARHVSHHAQLQQAGVLIHQRQDALLHAKTCVIDGVWASVGSSNIDQPRLVRNAEANLVVIDAGFAQQVEHAFRTAVLQARPVDAAVQQPRPALWQRGVDTLARRCAFPL